MGGGKGHHGGAWKVAYADFVTAMMALFLVLWITAQDTKIKEAVERAFRNPFPAIGPPTSSGIMPPEKTPSMATERGNFQFSSVVELNALRRIHQDLRQSLPSNEETAESLKLDLRADGISINVFDKTKKPVFKPDSFEFTEYGNWVFSTLSWVVAKYTNCSVQLEGHTERKPPQSAANGASTAKGTNYGPWELTADRANAARRKFELHGVLPMQIGKVSGYADTIPMPSPDVETIIKPEDEINRRVTVLLKLKTGA